MKKIILISLFLATAFSCKNEEKSSIENDDINKVLINTVTDNETPKKEEIKPQVSANFQNENLLLTGKINELEANSYINVNQKDTSNEVEYNVILNFEGKITLGKHQSIENSVYGITDAKHKFKLPQGAEVPTSYKQKGGEFEITKIENNQVDGNFSVNVYDMNKPEIVKNIKGSFEKLPIKNIGE